MKHFKSRKYLSWCAIAGAFGVWIAAMAAMAAIPNDHTPTSGPRVAAVTGILVLHQDPRTLQTVPVREVRPL